MKIFEIGQNHLLEKKLISIIKWGIYISLLTPLIYSNNFFYPHICPKTIFFRIVIEVVFAFYLILALFFPRYRPKLNYLSVSFSLFIFILTITSIFGVDFERSFWSTYERMTGLFTIYHFFALFLVLNNVFQVKKEWEKIFTISIIIAIISSWSATNSSVYRAAIGNDSFFASYILFNIYFSFYFLFKYKISTLGFLGFAGLSILVSSLFIATSARAVIISFLLSLPLLVFLFWFFSKNKNLKILSIVLLIVLIVSGLLLYFYVPKVQNFLNSYLVNDSLRLRLSSWAIAWKGFLERPFLGWGLENFNILYAKFFDQKIYLKRFGGKIWFDKSHNMFLDILIASGIFGLISYLALFFIPVFYSFKKRTKTSLIMAVLLITYFIQNLFFFDMMPGYTFFFLVLAFVSFLMDNNKEKEDKESSFFNNKLARIISSFLIFIFTTVIIYFGNVQPAFSSINLVKFKRIEDLEEQFQTYKKALNTLKYNNEINRYVASFFVEQDLTNTELENKETLKDILLLLEKKTKENVKSNPLNLRSKIILGRVYVSLYQVTSQEDYLKLAKETLRDCINLSPNYYEPYLLLSACYEIESSYEEAFKVIQEMESRGDGWKENIKHFKYVISIYEKSNYYQETISLYEELLGQNSKNGDLWFDFAVYLFRLGDKENAKKVAQQAINLKPRLKNQKKEILKVLFK
jgi:O-antigen ligase/tetratricopeptide (TPR) repeat protein